MYTSVDIPGLMIELRYLEEAKQLLKKLVEGSTDFSDLLLDAIHLLKKIDALDKRIT